MSPSSSSISLGYSLLHAFSQRKLFQCKHCLFYIEIKLLSLNLKEAIPLAKRSWGLLLSN
jgi:hypothetical protein